MNISPSSISKAKAGSCPHGLPFGACPVCSGMGGGGGSAKKADRASGEMSWDECFSVWQQMLKAKQAAQQKNEQMQAQMQAPMNFTSRLDNLAQKIAGITQKLTEFIQQSQAKPTILSKTLALAAKITIPVLNLLKAIPVVAQKVINFVQEKLANISDKLNAIFGELKNSIEKKISDKLKDFKKKFQSFFGIIDTQEVEDEEKKIEEDKRVFDLKTTLTNIKEKLSNNTN